MAETIVSSSSAREPATTQARARRAGSSLLLDAVQFVLIIAGLSALGWYGFAMLQARVAQNFASEALARTTEIRSSGAHVSPAVGAPLATLSIPRLDFSAVVLEGSDRRTLAIGVGHIEGTAFPGDRGNVALAGHRDTFFRELRHVKVGDEIFVNTPGEKLRYEVSSLRIVHPDDMSVLDAADVPTLTLVTCYPFWVVGRAPDRFIVRAVQTDNRGRQTAQKDSEVLRFR